MKKPYETLSGIEKNFNALYGCTLPEQVARYEKLFDKFKKSFDKNRVSLILS